MEAALAKNKEPYDFAKEKESLDRQRVLKEEKDKIRAETVIKYQNHFNSTNRRRTFLCSTSALGGIYLASKYVTQHAGFRLSIGGAFYMATMIAIEEVEHRRIKREKETGKQTFERL